jgi:hypothetical protein
LEAPLAPFHENRFQEEGSYPFSSIGLDHFGSFPVYPTRGSRKSEKRWGLLFFCLVTRAVHLEVVEHADVESFLLAYGRFTALRGTPKKVFCDLGRTNVAASDELGRMFESEHERIGAKLYESETSFHFNPVRTPHFGGNYERAIRTARKCLSASLRGVARLTNEVFATVLAQVASVINRRPIAHTEQGLPITPADVLQAVNSTRPFPVGATTYKQYRKVVQAVNSFWNKWRNLYLSQLSVRNRQQRGGDSSRLKVGDVVLIKRPSTNVFLSDWELTRIKTVSRNQADKHVRLMVVLTTKRKSGKPDLEELEIALSNVSLLEAVNYSSK